MCIKVTCGSFLVERLKIPRQY
ncbi:UNVERIFIED_CONTAM: hypothetical protein GTU68_021542 [Idotea baltica]|nr:hypothetical protein [Idotea baltica]